MTAAMAVNGAHTPPREDASPDHSPSRFTAVNGRDQPPSSLPNGTGTKSSPPEQRDGLVNGKSATEGRATPSHFHERPRESLNGSSPAHLDHQSYQSNSGHQSGRSSPHKRKRSDSQDRPPSPASSYHRHSLPKSPRTSPPRVVEPLVHATSPGEAARIARLAHSSYPNLDDDNDDRTSSNGTAWNEYDTNTVHHPSQNHPLDASDAHLAEALQRNNQEQDAQQGRWRSIRPESENVRNTPQYPGYSSDQRASQSNQVGPKRKRVFSNRTKTGCMTCRRRKKKCDENHPQCNNCTRGGFVCEGYTARSTWQKPSSAKGPIPLQSKDGYPEMPGQHLTTNEISPASHSRPPVHHSDGVNGQPVLVDDRDHVRPSYITSPPSSGPPHSQSQGPPWAKPPWPASTNPPQTPSHQQPPPAPSHHIPERGTSDYRDIPPISEISNSIPRSQYPMMPPIHELSREQPPKQHVSLYQQPPSQRPDYPVPRLDMNEAQAQMKAKMALEHSKAIHPHPYDDTEKDKMLRGDRYRPTDHTLREERDRCKAALFRFNNAGNPDSGFTENDRRRLLKEIVQPTKPITGTPSSSSGSTPGVVASEAIVETPFSCLYGYNITIGPEVFISEGCRILDAQPVTIGAKTWIGPGVTIQTTTADPNIRERKGINAHWQARPVTIGEMCYIGAGAVIKPGVKLQAGAYVADNAVVDRDVENWNSPTWTYY